jgi:hypothetical protein
MANIPVIPGVSVATKGILNKPLKDIICAILFGGINNMLKGPLLCINFDLNKIAEEAGLAGLGDLKAELNNIKDQLKAAEALAGIPETLARVNAAIAEVQSLLALDGMCKIPLKAPLIPDVISQVIDAEFKELNAILNDLGRLAKPSVCLNGDGGIGFGSGYNPDSILGSLSKHVGNLGNIPGKQLDALKKRLQGVGKALDKSINRQLFPDFRHKHDLTTGKPWVAGSGGSTGGGTGGVGSTSGPTLAPPPPAAAIAALGRTAADYPPADAPNLKSATATAQTLVASLKQTGSYPVKVDGINNTNIWLPILGPEVYSLAVTALTPQDPFFAQEEPIYDYCGKLVGYTSTVISGDPTDMGGNPSTDAILDPVPTTFEFMWIADRNCWAVTGNSSEQIIDTGLDSGRKGVYLNKNPDVIVHRGYNHTFSIPSIDISGSGIAPEFFVCYVDENLQPRKINGQLELFNLGLARLETGELLEDANGSFDNTYALERKGTYPTGTTLYFAAEQRVYSGDTAPEFPSEATWWYNLTTCDTKRWVQSEVDGIRDGTGSWVEVSESDRTAKWFGSSNTFGDPHVNYLAYSNQDGTVFGLFKFI